MTHPKRGELPGYFVIREELFVTSPWVAATCHEAILGCGFTQRICLAPKERVGGLRDSRRVEEAYAREGLSTRTAKAFVDRVTHALQRGHRIVVAGARDGEIESLITCFLAVRDGIPRHAAIWRMRKIAHVSDRRVLNQLSPPLVPEIDETLVRAFVAKYVTPTTAQDALAVLARVEAASERSEAPLALIEALDVIRDDPSVGARAAALQADLARRIGHTAHWSHSWEELRALQLYREDPRPRSEAQLVEDAILFEDPSALHELEERRPLTAAEHVLAASIWTKKALRPSHGDVRPALRSSIRHYEAAKGSLTPADHRAWGNARLRSASSEDERRAAVEILLSVPVGPEYAEALADVAATRTRRGMLDEEGLETLIESTWYGALLDEAYQPRHSASSLHTHASMLTYAHRERALRALWTIGVTLRCRKVIRLAIEACGPAGCAYEPTESVTLEAMLVQLAEATQNLADRRQALLTAATHADAQAQIDPTSKGRARRYRRAAAVLPDYPKCSLGVPQRR